MIVTPCDGKEEGRPVDSARDAIFLKIAVDRMK
jgi:hypothetical protein